MIEENKLLETVMKFLHPGLKEENKEFFRTLNREGLTRYAGHKSKYGGAAP